MKQRETDFLVGLVIFGLIITQAVFLTLKLTGVGSISEWSWFAVLMPTIIPTAIVAVALLLFYVIFLSFRR